MGDPGMAPSRARLGRKSQPCTCFQWVTHEFAWEDSKKEILTTPVHFAGKLLILLEGIPVINI